ncbi:MAG: amidohydrolase family protein [Pseudomonadales bacterium]
MSNETPVPGTNAWLDQVVEPIIDPEQPIIDPHHHLWSQAVTQWGTYELPELRADTGAGHNVVKTVFVECRSNYRADGPEHLRPVGETEYVAGVAAQAAREPGRTRIAGIVAHANLLLGADVVAVLEAHEAAGAGLFRGIRHAGPNDATGTLRNPGRGVPCPYGEKTFRDGLRTLGRLGYTYDTWHFHHQNRAYLDMARAVPDTLMILDHFGTPLGVGAYAGRQEEIFSQWKQDIADIARCDNVVAKLGGLAMPDNGFGWHERPLPPTSDEFVAAQRRYYLHAIECFGPERCMFESNFPVDRVSISYPVLWNGFKKLVAEFSATEREAMFHGTAARVYRI